MRRIRYLIQAAAILFLVWALTIAVGTAVAAAVIFRVPIDTIVRGPEGSVHFLKGVAVPREAVGMTCSVAAISGIQGPVHPNSDLIVTSDGPSVTMFDVEREGGDRTDADGPLTLGESAKIEVRLGADGIFSGGFIVEIVCQTNTPPDCSDASARETNLWPPKHKFLPITVAGVTDADGDSVMITVDSIFQDEAVDARGSGNTAPDGRGVGTSTAEVRAERVGSGNGRAYHIGFTADDGNGGACSGEVLVGVPHNKKGVAEDGGALFDSTVVP
jgi:hypothetical protein